MIILIQLYTEYIKRCAVYNAAISYTQPNIKVAYDIFQAEGTASTAQALKKCRLPQASH
jgi:hypothetical protein